MATPNHDIVIVVTKQLEKAAATANTPEGMTWIRDNGLFNGINTFYLEEKDVKDLKGKIREAGLSVIVKES